MCLDLAIFKNQGVLFEKLLPWTHYNAVNAFLVTCLINPVLRHYTKSILQNLLFIKWILEHNHNTYVRYVIPMECILSLYCPVNY